MISINLFFLLRKGIYPYEYMDDWDKLNEISIPDKKSFLQWIASIKCYWSRLYPRSKSIQKNSK